MKINELSYNATGARYGYNGTHEQDKELNADGNYLDFGNFGYDTRTAMRRNQEPLRAKYPHLSGYNIFNSNPIFYKDPDGLDWIKSTGDKVYWYAGDCGDESTLLEVFTAASGKLKAPFDRITTHEDGSETVVRVKNSAQFAKFTNWKDYGPTPEGYYTLNLEKENQPIKAKGFNTEPNPNGGIEVITDNLISTWGNYRINLFPKSVSPLDNKGLEGNIRNLYSCYFHDSQNGETSGCTEVESDFFELLMNFRESNPKIKTIDVIVEYPSPDHETNGFNDYEVNNEEAD